ncbi:50S ribosomal protein L9 [Candidatus Peregrinibacteria bacterium]|nr:50S ribosomal protein L9 [Candidatus Peregrinibacteria bacterium]
MKVVLTSDVKKLGYRGDILEVSHGYARNFLIPKKFAVAADTEAMLHAKKVQAERIKSKAEIASKASDIAKSLIGTTLTFVEKISTGKHLYGSVSETDIAQALKKQAKIEVEKKQIEMKSHIKEVGTYEVILNLYEGVAVPLKIEVQGKEEDKTEKKTVKKVAAKKTVKK